MKPQLLKCIGVIINQVVRVGAGELKKKKRPGMAAASKKPFHSVAPSPG